MRQFLFTLTLFSLLLTAGCTFNFETKEPVKDADISMGLAIDREKALEFSDKFVEDVIAEKNQEIYSKMTELFRKTYSIDEIPKTFEKMNSYFGKLVETKYKSEEIGYWMFPDGTKKPMRKFFYSTKTDKAEMGKYFLQVSVIAEGEKLTCASFTMLMFPEGLPDHLK